MTMAENSFIDIFDLCWNTILKESMYYSNTLFNEKHCSVDETRDTNFDVVENRLAYMYKFGYFNAVFIQKCLESFLELYSEVKELFVKDLNVCSLSNGPGFDLIGFFCGIYGSFKSFNSLPVFKTINLYSSWFCICHNLFTKVYQAAVESSNNRFSVPSEKINFLQCDIYSALSPEAQEYIKDSNILLMVKVFASTKASSEVVIKSMKEVLSFLKAGSFVFFVGSKKNTKELTANNLLGQFVNCIHGPIKISIADLPVNEDVVKIVNVKPKTSGNAYFIVWQKKDSVLLDNIPKKKRKRRKKKNSNIQVEKEFIETTAPLKQTDDTDDSLETLYSSSSKQSLSDDSHSFSSEKMSQSISPVRIQLPHLGKEEHSIAIKNLHSVNCITTLFDKIHVDSEEEDLAAIKDITNSRKESICIPEKKSQAKEFESCLIKEELKIENESGYCLLNEIKNCKQTDGVEIVPNRVYEPESQLIKKSNFFDKANNLNTILLSNDSIPRLEKNIQENKNEMHIVTQTGICSASMGKIQKEKTRTTANQVASYISLDRGVCDKVSNSNSINNLQEATVQTVIQNMKDKKSFSDAYICTTDNKNSTQIPENKSFKNNLDFKISDTTIRTPAVNDRNKDLHLLLQRCENLVTSVEKLTANFKNIISLNNDHKAQCCLKKSCTKFKIHHAYMNHCCFKPLHSHCCCRQVCNCCVFHHTTCTASQNISVEEQNQIETLGCKKNRICQPALNNI